MHNGQLHADQCSHTHYFICKRALTDTNVGSTPPSPIWPTSATSNPSDADSGTSSSPNSLMATSTSLASTVPNRSPSTTPSVSSTELRWTSTSYPSTNPQQSQVTTGIPSATSSLVSTKETPNPYSTASTASSTSSPISPSKEPLTTTATTPNPSRSTTPVNTIDTSPSSTTTRSSSTISPTSQQSSTGAIPITSELPSPATTDEVGLTVSSTPQTSYGPTLIKTTPRSTTGIASTLTNQWTSSPADEKTSSATQHISTSLPPSTETLIESTTASTTVPKLPWTSTSYLSTNPQQSQVTTSILFATSPLVSTKETTNPYSTASTASSTSSPISPSKEPLTTTATTPNPSRSTTPVNTIDTSPSSTTTRSSSTISPTSQQSSTGAIPITSELPSPATTDEVGPTVSSTPQTSYWPTLIKTTPRSTTGIASTLTNQWTSSPADEKTSSATQHISTSLPPSTETLIESTTASTTVPKRNDHKALREANRKIDRRSRELIGKCSNENSIETMGNLSQSESLDCSVCATNVTGTPSTNERRASFGLPGAALSLPCRALAGKTAALAVVLATKLTDMSSAPPITNDTGLDTSRADDIIQVTDAVSISLAARDTDMGSFDFHDNPIELELLHNQVVPENATRACVFWKILDDETFAGVWSGEGCSVTNEGANLTNSTTCSCDHLTNFAVLMQLDPNAVPIPKADEKALTILSILGGSLSILCLTLMLVIYALLGMYKTERGMVHTNLCVALLISQLVFLTGIDAVSNATGCRVAAVLLHYFLLASFSWMLVEGALLFASAKFVFHRQVRPWKLMLPGWGVPAVVVAITFAAAAKDYGSKEKCWLMGNTTWAFIAPVIFVVAVNLISLIFVLESLVKLKVVKSRTEFDKIRVVVRALLIVQPLMGYTWLFGLGVNAADGVNLIFYYLFVILNSSQGVLVFFLYCLNTEEVSSYQYTINISKI
ncbi:latrophilin-like protein LAT-2 [Patiria miniata]|uniref:Uncharacterized protein n=1 Tax=Patiria miniata TaxID=46514 RepID=A0A913ZL12_PATMI|nr:latrophilin-like protein LAT-2 [Patiria miniata]